MLPQDADASSPLNDEQLAAVRSGDRPLLIVAGAGTGKTRTLVHRVAHLISAGQDPSRTLLLTFTRRAATEMIRRTDQLLRHDVGSAAQIWGGTFHAIGSRLLRTYGHLAGIPQSFTILDRSDAEDFLDVVRTELGLADKESRFPKKGTCLSIYSYCVNAHQSLSKVLDQQFPWCQDAQADLRQLFQSYVAKKEESHVLDYDDLLLYWNGILADECIRKRVQSRFDCILVDEYQDTNQLQASILQRMVPDGVGLTVVGDDAQSIYSFRAASVQNILSFASEFPGTCVVKLEQNYRSTGAILEASNQVMAESRMRFEKNLWTRRPQGPSPTLLMCHDEDDQSVQIAERILENREGGLSLRQQAVLFRSAHHSNSLESELARRHIPFVKYGGLKFMEAAHIKDLLSLLRLAENRNDLLASMRVLQLLPGIGPKRAAQLSRRLTGLGFEDWSSVEVPATSRDRFAELNALMQYLIGFGDDQLSAQVERTRHFYEPLMEERYENSEPRKRDLQQLQLMMARFADRQSMLTNLALDPPASSEDLAGTPHLDEDYLILSTIHSAKGLEWKAVYLIHASDGNIPSDMATGSADELEEERRLFYVALTRAQDWLYVSSPQRYYQLPRGPKADRYGLAQLSRFVSPSVMKRFDCKFSAARLEVDQETSEQPARTRFRVQDQLQQFWD